MKAALQTDLLTIEMRDLPRPEQGPGEVLVKLGSVGVCASDVHYYVAGRIGDTIATFPHGLGHEPSGTIEAVGEGVDESRVGTRVALEPGIECGICELCKSNKDNLCPDVQFLGSPGVPGAFREYLAMPDKNCYEIPDSMSMAAGAMLEPFCVGVEALTISGMKEGQDVCVFGAGPIGISIMLCARAMGARKVYSVEPLSWRREAAKNLFGADEVLDNSDASVNVDEWIRDLTNGRGVDIACEASGDGKMFTIGTEIAVIGGTVVIIGIPEVDIFSFNPHKARRKGLTILNDRRSNLRINTALKLIEKDNINLSDMVTHRFSLEQTGDALEIINGYNDNVIKSVVELDPNG